MAGSLINKKIAGDLNKILHDELLKIQKGVKSRENLEAIGKGIVAEMKSMISKGISPIEGAGRFPEYKQRARAKGLRKVAKNISQEKNFIFGDSKYSRRQRREVDSKVKKLKKTAAQTENRGYPNSVKGSFPAKRARPVNLFLSGDFLKTLKEILSGSASSSKLEIGFKGSGSEKSERMEEGHRIGWLGQGKRPIIPQGSEKFAQRIQLVAEKILGQQLAKKLRLK